ncbi:MAG: hypothetical protein V3R66_00890 [Rhodospirillales bacterium]
MSFLETVIGWLSPSKPAQPGARLGGRRGKGAFVPAELAAAPAAVVTIADFDGSKGIEASNRLADILMEQEGLKVSRLNKRLGISGSGPLVERLVEAAEKGRRWLAESQSDILLWGEAEPGEAGEAEAVRIRFLARIPEADGRPGSFGLGDNLDLPLEFSTPLGGAVTAALLAAVTPTKAGTRQRPAEMLMAELEGLAGLIATPPKELSKPQAASVLTVIGNAYATMWRLDGNGERLDMAVAAYRGALAKIFPEEEPLTWALTQNHLGAVLEAKGDKAKDIQPFEAAIEAYKSVTKTLHRATHSNDWALAHVRLGTAYYRMGAISGRAQHYQDSTAAFEAALQVYTRAAMPGQWSETMNHLGVSYMGLGEQVGGTKALEQSVSCFRQALEVRGQDATPLLWAQTANNLGAAAFALAKRNSDTGLMNEACSCFEGASEIYARFDKPRMAKIINKNLFRVQRLLETRKAR